MSAYGFILWPIYAFDVASNNKYQYQIKQKKNNNHYQFKYINDLLNYKIKYPKTVDNNMFLFFNFHSDFLKYLPKPPEAVDIYLASTDSRHTCLDLL